MLAPRAEGSDQPVIIGVSAGGDGIGVLPHFERLETKKSKRRSKGKRAPPTSSSHAKDELDDDTDIVCVHAVLSCTCASWCDVSLVCRTAASAADDHPDVSLVAGFVSI